MTTPPDTAAADLPPGPDGLPLLGNKLDWARDPLGFPTRCAREYGDIVHFQFGRRRAVLLSHPEHIKYVLAENHDNYTKGEYFHQELDLLGDGLFTAEGEHWRRQRRLIDPIFYPDQIRSYGETMVDHARRTADDWREGDSLDVAKAMPRLTFAIATDALFNVDVGDEARHVSEAIRIVVERFQRSRSKAISLPRWVPTKPNREYRRAVVAFDEIVAGIIRDHRTAENPPDDVVSRLLAVTDEHGDGMSDQQVRDEVLTLMIAGNETVSLVLAYTWYCIATHPEVEARLVDELDATLGGRPPTVDDLDDLPYLERIVTEVMRLYPPVYFVVREPIEDDEIGGYRVPAGSLVVMNSWVIHRDPRWYDEPEVFDPDRWAADRERHPLAYFPFSGGPRRCIGDRFAMLEAQLVVATLAQRYRLELDFDPPLELDPVMTLRPKTEMRMVPRPR